LLVKPTAATSSTQGAGTAHREVPRADAKAATPQEAADADLIACDPARMPILQARPGKARTHINAIGADAPGNRNCSPT
jgi:ornithine cyclodeaminase/alanine dehydrogenase-like protein (mu-crystallin family)